MLCTRHLSMAFTEKLKGHLQKTETNRKILTSYLKSVLKYTPDSVKIKHLIKSSLNNIIIDYMVLLIKDLYSFLNPQLTFSFQIMYRFSCNRATDLGKFKNVYNVSTTK